MYGPNVYGVEKGAQYYFNKNVEELSLAECAYMAGINNSPNSYNPFSEKDNSEKIKNRTVTVLNVMLQEEYINKEEYEEAVNDVNNGLKFEKGDVKAEDTAVYSYMVDAILSEVIEDLQKKNKMSDNFAMNYLYLSGLKIYSTQNSDIQAEVESEFQKNKYIIKSGKSENVTSQAAMVVIDHVTGQVQGCVGGLGKKTTSRGFNRATQALRQTGSAIKPIAILGPALEEKLITPVTMFDDTKTTFADGYSPNDCDSELGNITVRRAVESSQNIPFVKMMEILTPRKSIKYMEKQGISTLTNEDCNLSLALGGLQNGSTPLEMAAAYATIANNGVYIEPTFYTKVVNKKEKTILKSKQKTKKVYSKDTTFVLKKLLTEPVYGSNGTAQLCKINGMEVAAKTGTTNDNYDKWLCGFTKYYTAVTWYGFDINESINEGSNSMANQIWANVMNNIHKNLVNADFENEGSVQKLEICRQTGKIAGYKCKDTYTEYFRKGTAIKDICDLDKHNNESVNNNKKNEKVNSNINTEDTNNTTNTNKPDNTNTTTTNNTADNANTTNKNTINNTNTTNNNTVDDTNNIKNNNVNINNKNNSNLNNINKNNNGYNTNNTNNANKNNNNNANKNNNSNYSANNTNKNNNSNVNNTNKKDNNVNNTNKNIDNTNNNINKNNGIDQNNNEKKDANKSDNTDNVL